MSKLKRIDIFQHPTSQYGVLGYFGQKLKEALERQHYTVRMFHPQEMSIGDILAKLQEEPPECTLAFNLIMPEASPLSELNIPHVAVLVDWATYYPELVKSTNSVSAFVDKTACEFFQSLGQKHVLFFPHAVEKEIFSKGIQAHPRDLEVVFSGTYMDEDAILAPWKEKLSQKAVRLMDQIAEETLTSKTRPHVAFFHDDEVLHELKNKQINIFSYFTGIDQLLRARDRIRLVQAVDGADLHIFGAAKDQEKWKKQLRGKRAVHFHDACSFEELFSIFSRAKYVLNSAPMHKGALHERLLYALSLGATVITNHSEFLQNNFPDTSALIYFEPPNYQAINSHLTQNEHVRMQEVMKARAIIEANHTWDHRVKLLQKELPKLLMQIVEERALKSVQQFF
jgi:hypothetical protein